MGGLRSFVRGLVFLPPKVRTALWTNQARNFDIPSSTVSSANQVPDSGTTPRPADMTITRSASATATYTTCRAIRAFSACGRPTRRFRITNHTPRPNVTSAQSATYSPLGVYGTGLRKHQEHQPTERRQQRHARQHRQRITRAPCPGGESTREEPSQIACGDRNGQQQWEDGCHPKKLL